MNPCRRSLALVLLAALAGCGDRSSPAAPSADPGWLSDPCADRLHDICGRLLLYCAARHELPQTQEDLKRAAGNLPLSCPTSGKPYVYNPNGPRIPRRSGRLILFDAGPSHDGCRWAIVAEDLRPGKPLVARVVRMPEGQVAWNSPPDAP